MTTSLFSNLLLCPDDPILQVMMDCRADTNPHKVDLSAGVYKDPAGNTPVLNCVREAEKRRIAQETTKNYPGLAGDLRFNALVTDLCLGADHPVIQDRRTATLQTTGGSGAIRIAGELFKRIQAGARVWVSDPTWGNHIPLLKAADLDLQTYPYYTKGESRLRFDEMMQRLQAQAVAGDVLLLHGSSHNPCGQDLNWEQWQQVTRLVLDKGLMPFVDAAYHGLSAPLDEDAAGWRYMASQVPEMLIAYSGSKSFSLYRDRAGGLISISETAEKAHILMTNLMSISRVVYSMPPAHGAFIMAEILDSAELKTQWMEDLAEMRDRICSVRQQFADALRAHTGSEHFDFIRQQNGMFSFLDLPVDKVRLLRSEYSIYLLDSGRVNIAGITSDSADYVAKAVASVL